MNSKNMMHIIGEAQEEYVHSALETRGVKKRRRTLSAVSKLVLVAAIIMSLATTAYATDFLGIKSFAGSSGRKYTSFEEVSQAVDRAQLDIEVKESFANGYTFLDTSTGTVKGLDENDNVKLTYKNLHISYTSPEGSLVSLSVEPYNKDVLLSDSPAKETRQIGNIDVFYFESTYKMFPMDMEDKLTEEDILWRDLPGNYISFGSDVFTPYETKVTQMAWAKDGNSYILTDLRGEATADTLFSMAEELISG